MQLGGNWVGPVCTDDLPVEMQIDWIRFTEFEKKLTDSPRNLFFPQNFNREKVKDSWRWPAPVLLSAR